MPGTPDIAAFVVCTIRYRRTSPFVQRYLRTPSCPVDADPTASVREAAAMAVTVRANDFMNPPVTAGDDLAIVAFIG
jgi:hypothetical protein